MATSHVRDAWEDGGQEQLGKAITVTLRGVNASLFQSDGVTTLANPVTTVLLDGLAQTDFYVLVGGEYRLTGPDGTYSDVYVNDNATAQTGIPTVAGSRGANAALASLLTALAGKGVIIDSTVV